MDDTEAVRKTLQRFQNGYSAGDVARVAEVAQFGVNRMRDRIYGVGHAWPFTFTAVLVRADGDWRFHTIHWSFPAS